MIYDCARYKFSSYYYLLCATLIAAEDGVGKML